MLSILKIILKEPTHKSCVLQSFVYSAVSVWMNSRPYHWLYIHIVNNSTHNTIRRVELHRALRTSSGTLLATPLPWLGSRSHWGVAWIDQKGHINSVSKILLNLLRYVGSLRTSRCKLRFCLELTGSWNYFEVFNG